MDFQSKDQKNNDKDSLNSKITFEDHGVEDREVLCTPRKVKKRSNAGIVSHYLTTLPIQIATNRIFYKNQKHLVPLTS